jgi:hypothetical protein
VLKDLDCFANLPFVKESGKKKKKNVKGRWGGSKQTETESEVKGFGSKLGGGTPVEKVLRGRPLTASARGDTVVGEKRKGLKAIENRKKKKKTKKKKIWSKRGGKW